MSATNNDAIGPPDEGRPDPTPAVPLREEGDTREKVGSHGPLAPGNSYAPSDIQRYSPELTLTAAETQIDADNYDILASVLYRDTKDAREWVARQHISEAVSEVQHLSKEQSSIGTDEQMEAIRRTGACPDARFWWIASWFLVLVDVVCWYIAGAQLFTF